MSENLNLGFCDAPRPKYVYCNRKVAGCNWYFFEDEKPVPIEWTALKCIILSVDFKTTERMQKESEKLRVRVRADREYVLEAGATTEFAKAFMRSWNAMTPEQKSNPVYIEPKPADKSATALFVEIYDHLGSRIRSNQDGQPEVTSEVNPIVQRVKDLVRLVGLPIADIRDACRGSGLPESAQDFKTIDQVEKFKTAVFTAWVTSRGAELDKGVQIPSTGNDSADFVELRRMVNASVPV